MKVRSVGAELFHAEGQKDRFEEAKNLLSQFSNALQTYKINRFTYKLQTEGEP
jgi:hypothetical protein